MFGPPSATEKSDVKAEKTELEMTMTVATVTNPRGAAAGGANRLRNQEFPLV